MDIYSKSDNYEAWAAWQCVTTTNVNVFLTGNAGTGKTTFLKNLITNGGKRMVVVAPTGVAAVNAGGVTIHSFFQITPGIFVPGSNVKSKFSMRKSKIALIRSLDLLVIDEVSMVRADLLDAIDNELRRIRRSSIPFGGVQLLLVGDLRQLSPVVRNDEAELIAQFYSSPYFFASLALQRTTFFTFELKKVYRQRDLSFVSLLNRVRENNLDAASFEALNSRFIPNFNPPDSERYIRLTTHNSQSDSINQLKLASLSGKAFSFDAEVSGSFPESSYPIDPCLTLKIGAQVMFMKNDSSPAHRFFNGKIAHVVRLEKSRIVVSSDDQFGEIEVERYVWENNQMELDPDSNEVVSKVIGQFIQFPLRLAWAITIHKSQGLTFEHAIIDAGRSFSPGQVYVALSRCKSLDGLVLSSRLSPSSVLTDVSINGFLAEQQSRLPSDALIAQHANAFAFSLVQSLFDFRDCSFEGERLLRILEESLFKTYPRLIASFKEHLADASSDILDTASRFVSLCNVKLSQGVNIVDDAELCSRIVNGCKYFISKMADSYDCIISETAGVFIDNKEIADKFFKQRDDFIQATSLKNALFSAVVKDGFRVDVVVRAKSAFFAEDVHEAPAASGKSTSSLIDIANKALYDDLRKWRELKSQQDGCSLSAVFSNRVLVDITNRNPSTLDDLALVPGVGRKKLAQFGSEVVAIVSRHKDDAASVKSHVKASAPKSLKPDAPPKDGSVQVSIELFRKYHDLQRVADERGLKISTIKNHLYRSLDYNGFTADDIMGTGRFDQLVGMLRDVTGNLPDDIHAKILAAKFDYADIFFVRRYLAKTTI